MNDMTVCHYFTSSRLLIFHRRSFDQSFDLIILHISFRMVLLLEPDLYPSLPFYKDEMYHMVYCL